MRCDDGKQPFRCPQGSNALRDPLRCFGDDLLPYVRSLQQEVVAAVVEGDQLLVIGLGLPVDLLMRVKDLRYANFTIFYMAIHLF